MTTSKAWRWHGVVCAAWVLAGVQGALAGTPAGDERPVEIEGTARIFHVIGAQGADERGARDVLIVQTRDQGDVFVRSDDARTYTFEHGATVRMRGLLNRDNELRVEELVAVGPPSKAVAQELHRERERAARERAVWASDGTTAKAPIAPDEFERLEQRLPHVRDLDAAAAWLDAQGEKAARAAGGGPLTTLILPSYCSLTDPLPTSPTPAQFEAHMNGVVSPFFDRNSDGRRTFNAVSAPWLDRCFTGSETTAELRAQLAGYNPDAYDRVVIVDPMLFGSGWVLFLGLAEDVPGRRVYMNLMGLGATILNGPVWAHELGHLEGLFHANRLDCTEAGAPVTYSVMGPCISNEYGDPSSPMGDVLSSTGFTNFSAPDRDRLGWHSTGELVTMTTAGSTVLWPYGYNGFSVPRAVRIPLPSGTVYVERRLALWDDVGLGSLPGLVSGVQLRVLGAAIDAGAPLQTSQLNPVMLDGRPATPGDVTDGALPWYTTWTTPEGVKIRATPIFFGLFARIDVSYPAGPMAPSEPADVAAVYDPGTNTAAVSWTPPLQLGSGGGALYYDVEVVPATAASFGMSTFGTSIAMTGFGDGFTTVRVRAGRIGGGQSEWIYAPPFFVWATPVTAADVFVDEDVTAPVATVTLSLPWPAPLATERWVRVLSGSATAVTDFAGPSPSEPPFAPLATTAPFSVAIATDPWPELNETALVHVGRPYCSSAAGFGPGGISGYPMECVVWEPVSVITILASD